MRAKAYCIRKEDKRLFLLNNQQRMKFGKLTNIDDVNFHLPNTPEITRTILQDSTPHGQPHFYIGATGWGMKEWVGSVYPSKTKSKDYLYYYARQFNTIELNTTHYRIPSVEMVQKWKESVPHDFKFCPKIPQSISHSRNLGITSSHIQSFSDSISVLEDRLGCCFMQLPPYFDVSRYKVLEAFLEVFPKEIPLAIELRHESWFNHSENLSPFIDLLLQYEQHSVNTDVAGRRDVLHMNLTSNLAMVRFVGNGLHPTDYQRIAAWVERIKEWIAMGLKTIYFFPHEPDNILAPEMAKFLLDQVKVKIPEAVVRGPSLNPETLAGQQMNLFD